MGKGLGRDKLGRVPFLRRTVREDALVGRHQQPTVVLPEKGGVLVAGEGVPLQQTQPARRDAEPVRRRPEGKGEYAPGLFSKERPFGRVENLCLCKFGMLNVRRPVSAMPFGMYGIGSENW
jgi:hypothetical protein